MKKIKREQLIKNIDEIIPYINNPRDNDATVDAVASSIKNFGFNQPIAIDSNNEIIAGHTRYKAAKKLGIKEVPCVIIDDLTDEEVKAYRLADNKVAELAEWDIDLLNLELGELENANLEFNMEDFGFEIDLQGENEVIEDDFECELEEETSTKQGDIFQLGRHRLMCGDSTSLDDVKKLMGGEYSSRFISYRPSLQCKL